MRTKRYFTEELAQQKFDAIVIGSGIGGLSTAGFLTKAGKKVLVLEKHSILGGFMHTFQKTAEGKKYEWDVGVHYIGMVEDPESTQHKMFAYLSDNTIEWASMGEVYDVAIIGGERFEFKAGKENQIQNLLNYFPEEEAAIRNYYDLVLGIGSASAMFFSEKTMPLWLSRTAGYLLRKGFYKYGRKTTYEVLRSLTDNEKLIAVLCAQCGNYGLPPKKSSFAIHATIVEHYINGGSYPVGGPSVIAEKIIQTLERKGSQVIANCGVAKVLVENGKGKGVLLENGTKLYSPMVISSIGAKNTFGKLLDKETLQQEKIAAIKKEIDAIPSSTGHICLSIGLNASDEELQLPKYNIWMYESINIDEDFAKYKEGDDTISTLIYVSFPSARDPHWQEHRKGTATIQVILPSAYSSFKNWEETKWKQRGEEYEKLKEKIAQQLLEKMYQLLPQIKGKVAVYDLSTPLSTKHFNNYQQGEMYGLEHTPARFEANRLRVETSIKNFFLTGQDMVCVGVGASIASGMITSSLILKKNLMSTVHSYNFKKDSQLSKSVSDSKVLQISEGFFKMKDWFSSKEK